MIYVTFDSTTGALIAVSGEIPAADPTRCTRAVDAESVDVATWNPITMRFDDEGKTTRRVTKQQFIDRFTPEEMTGILTAAKTNAMVEAWLFRFNSVTPEADGTSIDLDDPRTIAGLKAMVGETRAAEILA